MTHQAGKTLCPKKDKTIYLVLRNQTVKRFLPFRRRFANTRLPPTVELRLRKPCTRFLLTLLG